MEARTFSKEKQELVEQCYPLIQSFLRGHRNRFNDELTQEGAKILCRCAYYFDGFVKFTTYCYRALKRGLAVQYRFLLGCIKPALHNKEQLNNRERYSAVLIPESQIVHNSRYGEFSNGWVDQTMYQRGMIYDPWDEFINELDAPEDRFSFLDKYMISLTPKERMVIEGRFGLCGTGFMSLKEIGKRMKVSKQRVQHIEVRALYKMRQEALMMDYFDGY